MRMPWRRKPAAIPGVESPADAQARQLAEQVAAARRARSRIFRAIAFFTAFALFVFVFLIMMCFLINQLIFGIEHGNHAKKPAVTALLKVTFSSSDVFVVVGSLLALVAALAIAQQAATPPDAADTRDVAQGYAWQSATSTIGIVAGFLAVEVALLQWLAADFAHRWVTNLCAMALAWLTLALAATLQEWSDQTLISALRRAQLRDGIENYRARLAQFPLTPRSQRGPVRQLGAPAGLGLMAVSPFVIGAAADGDFSWFLDWRFYGFLAIVTAASFGVLALGLAVAAHTRAAAATRNWANIGLDTVIAAIWLVFGVAFTVSVLRNAAHQHGWELWVLGLDVGYVTAAPFAVYWMSRRSARWPAKPVQAYARRALVLGQRSLGTQLHQLDLSG